jgi:hypothetical protein
MDASGAPHVSSALYVMPDDPRLGSFRERFAGMLGELEERPGAGFAGAAEIEDTDDVLERIEASPDERVDAREYLAVRLVDLVLGDWDRHAGQYRWALHPAPEGSVWRPIPRDRDYAMVDYDGLLVDLARPFVFNAVRFRPRLGDDGRLLTQGEVLDRRLLGELPRAAWDSVVARVRGGLSDALVADAVGRLPREYAALQGDVLAAHLRARRDDLPRAAAAFYARLAREAEVHATAADEAVRIQHLPGGALEVSIRRADAPADVPPHFRRRFRPEETREVRVWLYGGADHAVVTGSGPILVRVVGGGGEDTLEDRGGGRTVFYDDRGDNRYVRGRRTTVDTRHWEPPAPRPGGLGATPPRDHGANAALLAPSVEIRQHAGVVVGAGPRRTRYGFRRHPEAVKEWARVLWAPAHGRVGVEAMHRRRWTGSEAFGFVFGRASDVEAIAFRGFGNDVPAYRGERRIVVWERQLRAEAGVSLPGPGGLTFTGAAVVRRTDPERAADAPGGDARGLEATWSAAGARAGLRVDRRGAGAAPGAGWTLEVRGAGFPLAAGDAGAFARSAAVGTAHVPLGFGPVLALRAGGEAAWGAFPVQEAVVLGSSETLRGHGADRYAGDRAAYGSVEVRQPLGSALGVFALADAGRAWYRGASPGGWHTALGGGAWVEAMGHALTLTLAHGERPSVSVGLDLPF